MRITGPSGRSVPGRALHQAVLVFALCAAVIAAPPQDDTPFAALARLAGALSSNDAGAAIDIFDRSMKDYGSVTSAVEALVSQSDILCAIDVIEERGEGDSRILDLDWYIELKPHREAGPIERRREKITVSMNKVRNRWKISSISSKDILDPLKVQ
jgi:hypothetical protein